MKLKHLALSLLVGALALKSAGQSAPIRLAVVGLVHDHARLLFPMLKGRSDFKLVGIVEQDSQVVEYYENNFHLDSSLFFPTFTALVAATKVEAVAAFTSTSGHRGVVEECAPLGINVMMEKPMATDIGDARAIAAAASRGAIQVIVNFETTWYPSHQLAYSLVNERHAIGDIRKILVQDGNQGPRGIKTTPYFFRWLTDPAQGGGSTLDFGCYGADLITWLLAGKRPISVTAVTQNLQPDIYTQVEDESTIILTYPRAQGIIQASWNWPYGRKDMEIYGELGSVLIPSREFVRLRVGDGAVKQETAPSLQGSQVDQLSALASVVRGQSKPAGMSSIAFNMVVTEILDAARESSRTGRRVDLPAAPPW